MARFRRDQRMAGAAVYRRVFDQPVRASDHLLTVLARANGLPQARLGLAVGRRHLPRAVDRNAFKRIIRESFRANQERLAGLDIIVLARSAAAGARRGELRAAIDRHWDGICRRAERESHS